MKSSYIMEMIVEMNVARLALNRVEEIRRAALLERALEEAKLAEERKARKEARRAARIAKHGLVWVEHIDSLNQKRLAS